MPVMGPGVNEAKIQKLAAILKQAVNDSVGCGFDCEKGYLNDDVEHLKYGYGWPKTSPFAKNMDIDRKELCEMIDKIAYEAHKIHSFETF